MSVRVYLDEASGEWVAEAPLSGLEVRAKPRASLGPDPRPFFSDHHDAQCLALRGLATALAEAAGVPGASPMSWRQKGGYGARASDAGPTFEARELDAAWALVVGHLDPLAARHVGRGGGS